MSPPEPIQYGGIRISAEVIAELDGHRAVVVVKRPDLVRVELRKGWHSNHPFLQLAFGGLLVAFGLLPLPVILRWLLFGGTLHALWVLATAMVLVGGWVVFDGLKRGFFLAVEGRHGRKKLCFDRRAQLAEIESYLDQAERLFGYKFEQSAW